MALKTADGLERNGFADIALVPDAVPDMNLDDIDLGTYFLGKKLEWPIIINAMTGGTGEAQKINQKLALLAAKQKIKYSPLTLTRLLHNWFFL